MSPPVPPAPPAAPLPPAAPGGFRQTLLAAFHGYANWLVGLSWLRFIILSVLLLIVSGVLQSVPPFSWSYSYVVDHDPNAPRPPKPPKPPKAPVVTAPKGSVQITIDEKGVRVVPNAPAASAPAPAASEIAAPSIEIKLPPGATNETVRNAVEEARRAIHEAIDEAKAEAEAELAEQDEPGPKVIRVGIGHSLPQLAFLWIVMSLILKIAYKGRIQAEVKAAQATETAEAESLKRQVVEARMAAMQAQVEPHFLFNTLASIDHLIETDPARASLMQKNLIALLRASMPTMREANANGVRDLGRELAVITPYLAILKVRMEDRLATSIDVPEGLRSAEFPPMMIQSLVENAIKHGLEPKPEGGSLSVKAEIVHGKLAVTVADTGLGFGKAATAGTGIGLNNIRERLALLYGSKATLTVAENAPSGTRVTIAVPYVAQARDEATIQP